MGRPQNRRVGEAIVQATQELLAEGGYARLTVDAVAARAGVGKAAIYRRYANKQEMIFTVVVRGTGDQPPADAGDFRADMRALCRHMAGQLSSAPSDVLNLLLADIYADSSVADRFSQTYLARDRAAVTETLERAVARRELVEMPDPAVVHALLMGPIFAWLLVLTEDPARLADLTDAVSEAATSLLLGSSPHVQTPPGGSPAGGRIDPRPGDAPAPAAGSSVRSHRRGGIQRPGAAP